MLAVIDADSILFRVAVASEEASEAIVKARFNNVMEDMVVFDLDLSAPEGCKCTEFEAYLSGGNNFRFAIAKTIPYKGNRPEYRPKHLEMLRQHAVDDWGFVVVHGIEADDAVGIKATEGEPSVVVAIDKDLDMIPGWHFNFVKKFWYFVHPFEAIKTFYKQLLTGDRVDNVPGLKGIGPKKAEKILKDCNSEEELYQACLKAYEGNLDYLKEQAALLWIQQTNRKEWTVPNETKEKK